jgi:hypothetical protein
MEIIDLPVKPNLKLETGPRYGHVPELDNDELASPEELERWAVLRDFEAVLSLPLKGRRRLFHNRDIDEITAGRWGLPGTGD